MVSSTAVRTGGPAGIGNKVSSVDHHLGYIIHYMVSRALGPVLLSGVRIIST